jgi:molecular chaperone GrpE
MPRPMTKDDAPASAEGRDGAPALQAENASLRDRLLRALADAENSRRRAERSGEDTRRYAVADFARELLTIADNLQRALAAAEEQATQAGGNFSLVEGVRATERMLMAMLERFGVRRIDAFGAPFDPALHEAIMEVNDPSRPPGTVVQVVEHGYTIHDRLLRPARVVVNRGRSEQPPSPGASAPSEVDGDDAATDGP